MSALVEKVALNPAGNARQVGAGEVRSLREHLQRLVDGVALAGDGDQHVFALYRERSPVRSLVYRFQNAPRRAAQVAESKGKVEVRRGLQFAPLFLYHAGLQSLHGR